MYQQFRDFLLSLGIETARVKILPVFPAGRLASTRNVRLIPSIWRILVSAQDLGCRHNGEDPSCREELDRVPLGAPASNAVVPLLIHIVEADADVK